MSQLLPAPGPADVGIVLALPIEAEPITELLREVRTYSDPEGSKRSVIEGMLGDLVVVLIVAGAGRALAGKGTKRLIDGHRPRWIVSLGFGGALDPALKRNDVFIAGEIVDASTPEAPPRVIECPLADSPPKPKARFVSGRLLTASKIIRTAAEKATLREQFAADVVDMETAAVAKVCADRGQRFLSIRAISDEAGTDLPPEVMTVMGPTGGFRLGATIGALIKRPGSVKDLWTLREHAIEAGDRLAEVLPEIVSQLP